MTTAILTRDALRSAVPSIFAASPWEKMSARYRHVPTVEVVDILEAHGFRPVRAMQSRARIEGKAPFTRHMLRLRHTSYIESHTVGEEIPELVVVNSHDGTSRISLSLGILRCVCQNGLCVPIGDLGGFSVRHSGGADFNKQILDATYSVVSSAPKALETVSAWKQISLPAPLQTVYAEAARVMIDNPHVTPEQLLQPRRKEDAPAPDGSRSLWHTFNNVEEAALKGGITNKTAKGRRTTTRPITSVTADLRLNKALWILAQRMAEEIA